MLKVDVENQSNEIQSQFYLEKIKKKVLAEIERNSEGIPYLSKGEKYCDKGTEDVGFWTNGFFAGSLWQLYAYSGVEEFKNQAIKIEVMLDKVLNNHLRIDHDAGFMWLHTAVANYKDNKNEESRLRAHKAVSGLASRFNINGSYIRAWNRKEASGWAIIDSMMNLPILFWGSKDLDDPRFESIAIQHANTLQEHLIRQDGSNGHIACFNPVTGEFIEMLAGQGYAADSSWSRGQSWAVYGFALAYKYTKDVKYLETAKNSAHYFTSNVSITDYIPRIDFRAPASELDTDTSAGLIAACGMLEISQYVPEEEKELYITSSKKIVQSILENHCNFDESIDGIVYGGAVGARTDDDRGISLVYADYFLIEYLLKLENKALDLW